ncbi:CD248 molecule, endosialin a [Corythoichthys intestinalis]|uniref:CD248 molecule, endosialin a n=1 Tax=Corythoichthys intestinalis TaxID=161448 RepID=UPI0025A61FA1|nr:CD248 molecule, endosialin a [Corythoichthys intestinalis]XP_061811021.1 endosialin-like [Nerophis lumbriciformis]
MGLLASGSASLLLTSLLVFIFWSFSYVLTEDLQERDALCNADGCLVVYFQRKTFLDAWRACKEKGGNLATVRREADAAAVHSLFTTVDLRYSRTKVQVWIGLQRQPRQCTATRPLRGFSWTTGDQDTEYTNWQKEYSHAMCSVPRCVVMGYNTQEPSENFKWLDGSCSVPVDGYLCHYAFKGMCPALWNEGSGNVFYATPFDLLSTLLTHLPLGSVATVPCEEKQQSVMCLSREDGSVGWSRDGPLCSDPPESQEWCQRNNGGCEHFCKQAGAHSYCECAEGYRLGDDGQSCVNSDLQFDCVPHSDGYGCACPEGYILSPDEHRCVDVDECLQSPCEHSCSNSPGTFQCSCREGYRLDEGICEDLDECLSDPCEHACENTEGSFVCHCRLGYSPQEGDPTRCQDTDECQIAGTCEQMCFNYIGGFECYCGDGYQPVMADSSLCQKIGDGTAVTPAYPWLTPQPGSEWDPVEYEWPPQPGQTAWDPVGEQSLDWLTDPPKVWGSDVIWVTSEPQEDIFHPAPETVTEEEDTNSHADTFSTTVNITPAPTTIFSTTVEFYEDEYQEEEQETTPLPFSSTSTISEGAWNWWAGFSTPHQNQGNPQDKATVSDMLTDSRYHDSSAEEKQAPEKENPSRDASTPLDPLQPFTIRNSEAGQEGRGASQSSTWLLVGLLVPICIFVVLMVVLGIVYCTRCAARPRSKSGTDCYHWISGAHDKQGAPGPSTGVKSHV